MPNYDYECKDCGVIKEEFRLIVDRDEEMKCVCGGDMKRCVSSAGIIFNGEWQTNEVRGK
jgi:putative FmdB family regulatory protein